VTTAQQYALEPDLQLALLFVRSLGTTAAERAEFQARRVTAALTSALGVLASVVALLDAALLLRF